MFLSWDEISHKTRESNPANCYEIPLKACFSQYISDKTGSRTTEARFQGIWKGR